MERLQSRWTHQCDCRCSVRCRLGVHGEQAGFRVHRSPGARLRFGGNSLVVAQTSEKERRDLSCQHPPQRWDNRLAERHVYFGRMAMDVGIGSLPGIANYVSMFETLPLREAVEALERLVQRSPDVHTSFFYTCLRRCMTYNDLTLGARVHALAVKSGYESNAFLANHIMGMYASHGKLTDCVQVFAKVTAPNPHMWATIILAHARHGQATQAIQLYRQMMDSAVRPDDRIFVAVLKACAAAQDLASGKEVHARVLASDLEGDVFVANSLVTMYAKCGDLEAARMVFTSLGRRDVVTWTAMIAGYMEQGLGQDALALYASMQQEGMIPADNVTFVCLLKACASVGALQQGKQLHAEIRERGLESQVCVGSSLVDMYSKCGSLEDARKLFDRLRTRNLLTWTAMLNGYAEHSEGHRAIRLFEDMLAQNILPDDTTFICLFVACSHAGLVHEGQRYFRLMVEEYGIVPTDHHYSCMVDLLGRSGRLDEAESMLQSTSFENDVVGWKALLSACKTHGDVQRGQRCFDHVVQLEPGNASSYVLLGNIYASAGRWDEVDRIENLRKSAGAAKKPAKACIEVKNEVHEFTVGEERSDISPKLRSVNTRLKEEGGHVPQVQLVLKSLSEQEKEDSLCGHAEKLALAFGLMNTPDGTTLLVTKNLRMCNDCHSSTKIMSRLEKREVIVRDAHRVHRFLDGSCSCRDRH